MKNPRRASLRRVLHSRLPVAAVTLAGAACAGSSAGPGPMVTPTPATLAPPAGPWVMAWSDEFDGPFGARVDATKWVTQTGGGGWGNNELEYYTDRGANAFMSGNGSLVIQALA